MQNKQVNKQSNKMRKTNFKDLNPEINSITDILRLYTSVIRKMFFLENSRHGIR